jgi:hypothetical protein
MSSTDTPSKRAFKYHLRQVNSRPGSAIELYGWDSRNEIWHGPTELGSSEFLDKRLLHALRTTASNGSNSWYGAVNCCTSSEPMSRFFVVLNDLSDSVIASIYCDESKAGPAEILAVVPANRRSRLRDEFAFEFLSFVRFLGTLSAGAELQVHDAIASVLADRHNSRDLVFSISSVIWPGDLDRALSCCVEKIAVTLCRCLDERHRQTSPA